jgi:hypothetical protein
MITSVTTTVVSIVSTVSLAGPLALVGILTLLALLVQKELSTTSKQRAVLVLSRILDIGIIPLWLVFVVIVLIKIAEALA